MDDRESKENHLGSRFLLMKYRFLRNGTFRYQRRHIRIENAERYKNLEQIEV